MTETSPERDVRPLDGILKGLVSVLLSAPQRALHHSLASPWFKPGMFQGFLD